MGRRRRPRAFGTCRVLVLSLLIASWPPLAFSGARKNLDPSPQDISSRPVILAHVVSGSEDGVADGMCVAAPVAAAAAAEGLGEKKSRSRLLTRAYDVRKDIDYA